MYKALSLVALLVTTFTLTSGTKPADASTIGLPSPVIVAKAKLVNQSANIPPTTVFTPTQTGLYRLSVYMSQTTVVPSSSGSWVFVIGWTDDAGSEASSDTLVLFVNQSTPNAFGVLVSGSPGNTLIFEAKAGQPVTYSVTLGGDTEGGTYSLYYTVERLE